MLLTEVLHSVNRNNTFNLLQRSCSVFLSESESLPLSKNLPTEYNDLHKVKIRWKKGSTLSEAYDQAFGHGEIRQRAIFANGSSTFKPTTEKGQEPFYIFPINGYKYTYSREIENSSEEYKKTFDAIFEQIDNDKGQAIELLTDLLKFTYTKENLSEGIKTGSEIILYNIPYYFAVRGSLFKEYSELLKVIEK